MPQPNKPLAGRLADYKPVKLRLHEFRQEHPDWSIMTTMTMTEQHWLAETVIRNERGQTVSNGHAYEQARQEFDMEKAETSAIGRALVAAGWTDSLELTDAEIETARRVDTQQAFQSQRQPGVSPIDQANATRKTAPRVPDKGPAKMKEQPDDPESQRRNTLLRAWPNANLAALQDVHKPRTSDPKSMWKLYLQWVQAAHAAENAAHPANKGPHHPVDWNVLTNRRGMQQLTKAELINVYESFCGEMEKG